MSHSWLFERTLISVLLTSLPPLTFLITVYYFVPPRTKAQKLTWIKDGEPGFISQIRYETWLTGFHT